MQFLKHQSNDYIWLQLRKKKFGFKQYICICYMLSPPADSPYIRALDLDYFDVLEKEMSFHETYNITIFDMGNTLWISELIMAFTSMTLNVPAGN
jgi:hypothetical protein